MDRAPIYFRVATGLKNFSQNKALLFYEKSP
nr:MAG TPA: hypothetical protein [Caudoviricetes sp.]